MLLPNTDSKSALILANQLRQTIEQTGFNASGTSVAITISCGVTEFLLNDTDETAFERADQALYQAKEQDATGAASCKKQVVGANILVLCQYIRIHYQIKSSGT